MSFGRPTRPPTAAEARVKEKARVKRAALKALRRAQAAADKAGVKLSDWEGEFLGSVTERVETYGRAFGDPELGAPGQALSAQQTRKLREIAAKANGDRAGPRFSRKRPTRASEARDGSDDD